MDLNNALDCFSVTGFTPSNLAQAELNTVIKFSAVNWELFLSWKPKLISGFCRILSDFSLIIGSKLPTVSGM